MSWGGEGDAGAGLRGVPEKPAGSLSTVCMHAAISRPARHTAPRQSARLPRVCRLYTPPCLAERGPRSAEAVSYTHLDVYKRQTYSYALRMGAAAGSATAFSDELATKEEILKLLNTF